MSLESREHEGRDRLLAEAIDAYVEAVQGGQAVSPQEWAGRYPTVAEELRTCLESLALLNGRAGAEATGPPEAPAYTLLEQIGRGGMGVVYRAVQRSTKRVVAVKFLSEGALGSPAARRRFEREVELAASLDHPGIVRVLESGEAGGRAYYAMEYVRGRPLHEYVKELRGSDPGRDARATRSGQGARTTRILLECFLDIADAVRAAHLRGVIHRDLKPANILVDEAGRTRMLDFGLARAIAGNAVGAAGATLATQPGQLLGTLPYLSPEQAAGRETDARSDIYALGVILYGMLTGRAPYDTSGSLGEALRNIGEAVAVRPSRYAAGVSADLDAVVLKALEKSPARRYQSVAELAGDVRSYLRGEPVEANRTQRFFLLRKAYARHRRQFQVVGAGLGLVLTAAAVILALYVQVHRERDRLAEELHLRVLREAGAHLAAGHDGLAEALLRSRYRARPDGEAFWSLLGYFVENPLAAQIVRPGWVTSVAWSADGKWLVYGTLEGRVAIVEASEFRVVLSMDSQHAGEVTSLAFSGDKRWLASAGRDGEVRVWRAGTWAPHATISAHPGGVARVGFDSTGEALLTAGADGRICRQRIDEPKRGPDVVAEWPAGIEACDFSADGRAAAIAPGGAKVVVVDMRTGESRVVFDELHGEVEAVRFSPDGRRLAVWDGGRVSLWDLDEGRLRWSGDGGLAEPRPTSLWDFPAGQADRPASPHVCWRPEFDFSADGRVLVSSGWDAATREWDVSEGCVTAVWRAHGTAVYAVALAPGGRLLAAGSVGPLRVWDRGLGPGAASWRLPARTKRSCVTLSGDGRVLAWAAPPDARVWLARTGSDEGPVVLRGETGIEALSISDDGTRIATAGSDGSIVLWDASARRAARAWRGPAAPVRSVALWPDGSRVAAGDGNGRIHVWDCATGEEQTKWAGHAGVVLALRCNREGTMLMSGGTDWWAKVWDVSEDGRPDWGGGPRAAWRHREWLNGVAFAPEGGLLASGSSDLLIEVHGPDGVQRWRLGPHAHWVNAVAFLERGRVVASGSNDGTVRCWDARTGTELATLTKWSEPICSLDATDDGRLLAVGGSGRVRLIDLASAEGLIERHFGARRTAGK